MKFIKVRETFDGQHCWPQAPEEVEFLRHPHRHRFHVALSIQVKHDDRELEFFMVQRTLKSWLPEFDLGYTSCEMIADKIVGLALKKYGARYVECEVSEDGENSATVRYP